MTPVRCVCGHLEGDHKSSQAPAPHKNVRGFCFLCACEEFRADGEAEREGRTS